MGYSEHPTAINVLAVLLILAFYSMWGMSNRNAYFDTLRKLRDNGPHFLPGSTVPLLTKYTGIGPVDYGLSVLQCFFAQVTDGSAPHLSLLGFYFAGQFLAVITGVAVESQRSFNRGKVVSSFLSWGLAVQTLGFGIAMPMYAMLHLATSERFAATSKHSLGSGLLAVPQAVILGYVLPTLAALLPIASIHQQLVAMWQFFPVWMSSITFINKSFLNPPTTSQTRSQLSKIYHFGENVALWTHRLTISGLLLIKIKPDLFPQSMVEKLTFSNVFVPPPPYSTAPVTLLVGAQSFLKYDMICGFLAALVWQFSVSEIYLYADVALDTAIKGPGYTFLRITEIRDQILFDIVQAEEDKVIKQGFSDVGLDENFMKSAKKVRDQGAIDRKGKLNSY